MGFIYLRALHYPSTILQYVDHFLLCSTSLSLSKTHTAQLLKFLGEKG